MKKIVIVSLFLLHQFVCIGQTYLYEPGTNLLDSRRPNEIVMWGKASTTGIVVPLPITISVPRMMMKVIVVTH